MQSKCYKQEICILRKIRGMCWIGEVTFYDESRGNFVELGQGFSRALSTMFEIHPVIDYQKMCFRTGASTILLHKEE